MMSHDSLNLLFICSMNQWRSPTAEKLYARTAGLNARSRGTSRKAVRSVSADDLKWADLVMVMEDGHLQRLKATFPGEMQFKHAYVLDVPDDFRFMDPDLIDELRSAVDPILANL